MQLPNWWHYAAVYTACVRIGAVINPLMPIFRERELEMSFLSAPSLQPLLASNRVRPLAVSSAKRVSFLPALPTLNESALPGYDYANWNDVVAPAGLPKEIVTRLNSLIVKLSEAPDVKESFRVQGLTLMSSTPEQFAAFIRNEATKNVRLSKLIGIKAE